MILTTAHSILRKPVVLLGLTIVLLVLLYALVGCDLFPKPTATAVPPTKPPATATPAPPKVTPTAAGPALPSDKATYVGAEKCKTCHSDRFTGLQETLHPRMIQDIKANPKANIADWTKLTTDIPTATVKLENVVFTLGSKYRQRYIEKQGDDLVVQPTQWNNSSKKWTIAKAGSWIGGCVGCHTTGFDPASKKWADIGVTCEACHGPGSEHVAAGGGKGRFIWATPDAQVCGQCHTRKDPAEKAAWPAPFRPGGDSVAKFKSVPKSESASWWKDGHAKEHRQQYLEWLESGHAKALETIKKREGVPDSCLNCHSEDYREAIKEKQTPPTVKTAQFAITCVTCHKTHSKGTGVSQLREEEFKLCTGCHTGGEIKAGSAVHHPMKEAFEGKGAINVEGKPSPHLGKANCAQCHMIGTAKSSSQDDVATHNVKIIFPGKAEKGEPAACVNCHVEGKGGALKMDAAALQNIIDTRQKEIKDKLAALKPKLEAAAKTANWDPKAKPEAWTANQKLYAEAYTNYTFVESEGSAGIHNYAYDVAILKAVEAVLGKIK